jgi:hypothetical protein
MAAQRGGIFRQGAVQHEHQTVTPRGAGRSRNNYTRGSSHAGHAIRTLKSIRFLR